MNNARWYRAPAVVAAVLGLWLFGSASAEAITGGVDLSTPADAPGLVLLQGPATGGAENCTATIVRPLWLITAAHCFIGTTPAAKAAPVDMSKWSARVGWVSDPRTHGALVETDRVVVDPQYTGGAAHDLALVHITSAVTTVPPGVPVAPVTVATAAQIRRVTKADKLWALGYGGPFDAKGLPVLRKVQLKGSLQVQGNVLHVDVDPKHNVQGGDSGGPLVVNQGGRWIQVGALEGFHQNCRFFCTPYDNYANLGDPSISGWLSAVVSTPGAPRDLVAKGTTGQVQLTWSPPLDNGDGPVTGYVITWNDGARDQTRTVPGSPPTYTVTGLEPGKAYDFSVAARNSGGLGPAARVTGTAAGTPSTTAVYTLASVSSDGVQGTDVSDGGTLSGDGSLVAFHSRANNLVPGDTNGTYDVFVRNVNSRQTSRISTSGTGTQSNGPSSQAQISTDGTKVLFLSTATNLVPGVPTPGVELAYLKDVATGTISVVSTTQSGAPAVSTAAVFTRSAGSLAVLFTSQATDLVPSTPDARDRLYLKNLTNGTVSQIPLTGDTGPVLNLGGFAMTPDGAKLFYSYRNFNDSVTEQSVYARDMTAGTTSTLLTANHESDVSSVSADGSVVGLESYASDLVPGDSNGVWDAFAVNTGTHQVTLLSSDTSGVIGGSSSGGPLLAPDGRSALFSSAATNLVAGDTNGQEDLFRKDLASGATTLLSPAVAGSQNDGFTAAVQFSTDGTKVGVRSSSNKLIATDTNARADVFVLSL